MNPTRTHLAVLATAALFAPEAAAQEPTLSWSGGNVGQTLSYAIEKFHANEPLILLPSLTKGPTPVGLVCPGDQRLLSVGLELQNLWQLVPAGPDGSAQVSFALPPNPALAGLPFHAQAMALGATGCFIGEITNPATTHFGAPGTITPTGATFAARRGHTATVLENGLVMVAGGQQGEEFLLEVELYDPNQDATFLSQAMLIQPRRGHTATLLEDGRILIVGGVDPSGQTLSMTEIIDLDLGLSVPGPPLPIPLAGHATERMASGRVVVVGGSPVWSPGSVQGLEQSAAGASNEVFHLPPDMAAWMTGQQLPFPLILPAVREVAGGLVVAGGVEGGAIPNVSARVLRLNEQGQSITWTQVPELATAVYGHSLVELADGQVIAAGGTTGKLEPGKLHTVADVQRLLGGQSGDEGIVGSLAAPRSGHTMVMGEGGLMVLGGHALVGQTPLGGPQALAVESAPLGSFSFLLESSLPAPRPGAEIVAIEEKFRLLVVGGTADPLSPLATAGDLVSSLWDVNWTW